MANLNRRTFLAASAAVAAAKMLIPASAFGTAALSPIAPTRILVGSGTPDGILSFAWNADTGELKPEGIATPVSHSTWLAVAPDRSALYVACELDEYQGKPTGAVASFALSGGKLTPLSTVASAGKGTCHLTTDHTGRVVICANYTGGSAASFLSSHGKLGHAVWSESYKGYSGHGPVADRQEAAHAHFASVSPDNRFAYINDLGADVIHIYKLDAASGKLAPAGTYKAQAGDGPRTLHFHPNGKAAYCMNELNSTVTVLSLNPADGILTPIQQRVPLLHPKEDPKFTNTGCDTVLTRNGRFAYFANRGDNFLMSFHIDPASGKLTPFAGEPRTSCGGNIPRNFTLDPTERWMLVANQGSSNLSVFARNPKTGVLSNQGKSTPATRPMCIVFV